MTSNHASLKSYLQTVGFAGLLVFLLSFTSNSLSANPNTTVGVSSYCGIHSVTKARYLEEQKPVKLTVKFKKFRKWQKNNLRILSSHSRNIHEKHKKRHKAHIEALYPDGTLCVFKAKIRQSGDWKDHIKMFDGGVISSIDVSLSEGHINNIVDFKLLIPETRNGKNEVIFTSLLSEMGFIAPRTYLIDLDIGNRTTSSMLFQEKQSKELLEANGRREGPMFEGDESTIWSQREGEWGIISERDFVSFSRLVKRKWAGRGDTSMRIAVAAQSNLNTAISRALSNARLFPGKYFKTYLDPSLISKNSQTNTISIKMFDSLVYAAGGNHGLRLHNRKYYYNAIFDYFEFIYYDGDIKFFVEPDTRLVSPSMQEGAEPARNKLSQIDKVKFRERLKNLGVEIGQDELDAIFRKLDENLRALTKVTVLHAQTKKTGSVRDYLATLPTAQDDILFAEVGPGQRNVRICDQAGRICVSRNFDLEVLAKLLAGKLKYKGRHVRFTQSTLPLETAITEGVFDDGNSHFKYIKTSGTSIETGGGKFRIIFAGPNDWLLVLGGSVNNLLFEAEAKTVMGRSTQVITQRFNTRLLTGCLTFIGTKFSGTRVRMKGSHCEDSLNIISGHGKIEEIDVLDAAADGVDVDFSRLKFKKVFVGGAMNDCIDVSAGHYEFEHVQVSDCADKGLSVGERSRVTASRMVANKFKVGLAVKDSSEMSVSRLEIDNVSSCVEAYRKKQEFIGGLIWYRFSECAAENMVSDPGSAIVRTMN